MTIVTWVSALGAGAILLKLTEAIIERFTGKQGREQTAWGQRDAEAKKRRLLEEYAHLLRRDLIDAGYDADELPPWPRYTNTD